MVINRIKKSDVEKLIDDLDKAIRELPDDHTYAGDVEFQSRYAAKDIENVIDSMKRWIHDAS